MTAGFHEVRFPLRIALGTTGGPTRRTDIVDLSNGGESRNARWRDARRRYDAGSGVRGIADLYAVLAFFEARQGQLYGFRFRDPLDFRSGPPDRTPSPFDQPLGQGDGTGSVFALSKTYGDLAGSAVRTIAKPVDGTVSVAVGGAVLTAGQFTVEASSGLVTLADPPAPGALITAGFEFDVPVRFDTDRIEIDLSAFEAGRIPHIPLVEIRP